MEEAQLAQRHVRLKLQGRFFEAIGSRAVALPPSYHPRLTRPSHSHSGRLPAL